MQVFKISDNVVFFLHWAIKTWRMHLWCGVMSTLGVLTSSLPLLFIIALTPLSMILSDMISDYIHVLPKGTKINHILYMDDLKLTGKNKSEIESLTHSVRVFSSDIRMDFRI